MNLLRYADGPRCRELKRRAEFEAARIIERIAELRDFTPRTWWTAVRLWNDRRALAAALKRARAAKLRLMAMAIG